MSLYSPITLIIFQSEILILEVVNVFNLRIKSHGRQRQRFAAKLLFNLFKMVMINMRVAKRMHKLAGLKIADLRQHHGQQRIGGILNGTPRNMSQLR